MATLQQRLSDLATRAATECKSIRTLVNGNAADLAALATTDKSNLVNALNELHTELGNINPTSLIDDAQTSATDKTWSIDKIASEITTAIGQITSGAPAALDTLDELANALGDDANFAATVTAALGNRLRIDAAQGLTPAQQTQGRANIGAQEAAAIGDPDTDLVAVFEGGLV